MAAGFGSIRATDRLPGMVEAFGKLPTQSANLDGELVLLNPGAPLIFTG
jgi:ATP-dependent DNA ligase